MQVITYNIPTSDARVCTFLLIPALRCKRNADRGRGIWSATKKQKCYRGAHDIVQNSASENGKYSTKSCSTRRASHTKSI